MSHRRCTEVEYLNLSHTTSKKQRHNPKIAALPKTRGLDHCTVWYIMPHVALFTFFILASHLTQRESQVLRVAYETVGDITPASGVISSLITSPSSPLLQPKHNPEYTGALCPGAFALVVPSGYHAFPPAVIGPTLVLSGAPVSLHFCVTDDLLRSYMFIVCLHVAALPSPHRNLHEGHEYTSFNTGNASNWTLMSFRSLCMFVHCCNSNT